ncbi:MAG: glycosyltransferase family 9 protein [Terrimicrobiaceae bacterium]|nr:glycosyltransferase family 9 protein [Terrimicrobiaceae bacterium]
MPAPRNSILIVRGGAIGDFILTLPALRMLREGFPDSRIEIIGYRHICELARGRYYADAVRSIEFAPMAGFFNPKAELDPALSEYFAGFGQVVSYLFDPDGYFAQNLRRAGVKSLLTANPRIGDHDHAARQLARPLEQLALFLDDPAAVFFPSSGDRTASEPWLERLGEDFVAVHPGSGSPRKNWPLEFWLEWLDQLAGTGAPILVVGGESDAERLAALRARFGNRLRFAENVPLCTLGTILGHCRFFVGHDSGISHLAAAAGAPCHLLFGVTDPAVWAPANPGVNVIAAPDGSLDRLSPCAVLDMILPG